MDRREYFVKAVSFLLTGESIIHQSCVFCVVFSSCQDSDLQWDGHHSLDEGHCLTMQGCWRPSSYHQVAQGKVSHAETIMSCCSKHKISSSQGYQDNFLSFDPDNYLCIPPALMEHPHLSWWMVVVVSTATAASLSAP